jgi:hypothetical protein
MVTSNLDPDLFERIVQEVVRRLLQRGVTVERPTEAKSSNELRIDAKVVALASLEGKLNGIGRVIVARRAVVTPAVKDALKDREIELIRG